MFCRLISVYGENQKSQHIIYHLELGKKLHLNLTRQYRIIELKIMKIIIGIY